MKLKISDQVIEFDDSLTLLEAGRNAGLDLEAPCGGNGKCGKCRVHIRFADGVREVTACRTRGSELREMAAASGGPAASGDPAKTRWIPEVLLPDATKGTSPRILTGDRYGQAETDGNGGLRAAYDIGTTTVVCYLLDGSSGEQLAVSSMLNPQVKFGGDVISRIQYALKGHTQEFTDMIRSCTSRLLEEALRKCGRTASEVTVISVVGNPCMQQFFFGDEPDNLVRIPYGAIYKKAELRDASPYFPACAGAKLLLVPDIAGYVGADTVGCVLSTGMNKAETMTLMIDIGTNGEMVLGNRDGLTACATAAGPALEGARITFGMRGALGAVEHVEVEYGKAEHETAYAENVATQPQKHLSLQVIGGGKPVGICGSGLIDLIAVLLWEGLINARGRMVSKEECPAWAANLGEVDGERVFFLSEDVYLTQNDVREVQMAKGAIAAGIELMTMHLGITYEQIGEVLLAGAFGSYIRIGSALAIGLIPKELQGKVHAVGNAAGSGSKMLAAAPAGLAETEKILEQVDFIELASMKEFQKTFAKKMKL